MLFQDATGCWLRPPETHTLYILLVVTVPSPQDVRSVSWDSAMVEGAREYRLELSRRRARYAKGKGLCNASPVGVPSVDSKKESSKGLG